MRLHLFELADQPWFPRSLADAGTAYLATLQQRFGLDALVAPHVRRALEASGAARIVDLCSGGGGPLLGVRTHLEPVELVLTDLQPNIIGSFLARRPSLSCAATRPRRRAASSRWFEHHRSGHRCGPG